MTKSNVSHTVILVIQENLECTWFELEFYLDSLKDIQVTKIAYGSDL